MLIARGVTHDGKQLLLIGLSRRNLELLQQERPILRDFPPDIDLASVTKISIIFGETEQEIADRLRPVFVSKEEADRLLDERLRKDP